MKDVFQKGEDWAKGLETLFNKAKEQGVKFNTDAPESQEFAFAPYCTSNEAWFWSPETGSVTYNVGPGIDDAQALRDAIANQGDTQTSV